MIALWLVSGKRRQMVLGTSSFCECNNWSCFLIKLAHVTDRRHWSWWKETEVIICWEGRRMPRPGKQQNRAGILEMVLELWTRRQAKLVGLLRLCWECLCSSSSCLARRRKDPPRQRGGPRAVRTSWWGGLVDKDTGCQTWRPESPSQDPSGGRWQLVSANDLWTLHTQAVTHTQAHTTHS